MQMRCPPYPGLRRQISRVRDWGGISRRPHHQQSSYLLTSLVPSAHGTIRSPQQRPGCLTQAGPQHWTQAWPTAADEQVGKRLELPGQAWAPLDSTVPSSPVGRATRVAPRCPIRTAAGRLEGPRGRAAQQRGRRVCAHNSSIPCGARSVCRTLSPGVDATWRGLQPPGTGVRPSRGSCRSRGRPVSTQGCSRSSFTHSEPDGL